MQVFLESEAEADLKGPKGGNRQSGTIRGSARGVAVGPGRPILTVFGAGAVVAGIIDILEGILGRDL